MLYQTNPTEIFRERQLALLREADDRRLVRRHLRAASEDEVDRGMRKRYPNAEAVLVRPEESWLQILWSTGPVP